MSCTITKKHGVGIILCSRGSGRPRCSYCSREGTKLCDFPTAAGKTCDKRICGQCAESVGANVDHCRVHRLRGDK